MTCPGNSVSLFGVWLVSPGAGSAAVLRVTGTMTGPSPCAGGSVRLDVAGVGSVMSAPVDPFTGRFRGEVPAPAPPAVGSYVSVTVTCTGDPTCSFSMSAPVLECDVQVSYFQAQVATGALTPHAVAVSGFARACATDRVEITSNPPGLLKPVTATVDPYTGTFTVVADLLAPLTCDARLEVVATCVGQPACHGELYDGLDCPQCFRASVASTAGPCTGTPPRQPVTFTSTIGLPTGRVQDFQWDYGDGTPGAPSLGPVFTVDNSAGTAASTYTVVEPPHDYASGGTYTASLQVVPPPFECPATTITVAPVCDACPTVTVRPPAVDAACVGGTRLVSLGAEITTTATGLAVVQWDYGHQVAGSPALGPAHVVPAGSTLHQYAEQHLFPAPGVYQATLTVVVPAGCPAVPVTVTVPPCDPPPCTLDVTGIGVTVGGCRPDGTRVVVATPALTNLDPADEYWWTFDGVAATAPVGAGPVSHAFPATAGATTHSVGLVVRRGNACLDQLQVPVVIEPCEGCPSVGGLTVSPGPCAEDRPTRDVVLHAVVVGQGVQSFHWDFGDGATETRLASAGPDTTHAYVAPGSYTATLTAEGPGTCRSQASVPVTVASCCYRVATLTTQNGTCVPGTGGSGDVQQVTLTATASGPGPLLFSWDFGDGTTAGPSSQPTSPAHGYAAPGSYAASVTVTGDDPTCPPASASVTVTVSACPPPPPPPPSGGGCLCVVLLVLALFLLALASAGLLAWGCGGFVALHLLAAASAAGVLGLLLLLLWALLCGSGSCAALVLVLTVLTALAVGSAALSAVLFLLGMVGCAVGALLAGALFAAAAAVLAAVGRAVRCLP